MTVRRVSAKEALSLVNDEGCVYVDVRSIPEFEMGHPAGAFNVPLMHMSADGMQPNAEFVAVMKSAFPLDQKIVLGCKAGGRSLRALQTLAEAGFTNLVDQRAGFSGQTDPFGRTTEPGWQSEGLPTSTVPAERRDYASLSKR